MVPNQPKTVHPYAIIYRDSELILSSVSSDARRESSETLSFQGLSTLDWVLVGFSLLVVSGLATYFSFRTEKKKNGRERPLNSWMNVWIYAADIVNNRVAEVIRPGPGRTVRSWWLLGIVFLLQFRVAGMKSDLLSRLFETRQIELRSRRQKFLSREFIFDTTVDSASTTSWPAQNFAFLSPVFHLWIIGMSLATVAFCVEFYLLRRRPLKVSPHHSTGIEVRA